MLANNQLSGTVPPSLSALQQLRYGGAVVHVRRLSQWLHAPMGLVGGSWGGAGAKEFHKGSLGVGRAQSRVGGWVGGWCSMGEATDTRFSPSAPLNVCPCRLIALDNNALTGTIPSSLGTLTNLT